MTRPLDRRQFLKGASGALIGLTHLKGSAHAASQGDASSVSSADWKDLARSLKGSLLKGTPRLRQDRETMEPLLCLDSPYGHRPLRFG
jgi:hypothetical protein